MPLVAALTRAGKSVSGTSLTSLKQVSCGAAPLSTKTIEEFMLYFPHVDFIQGYGIGESTAIGTSGLNTRDVQKYASAGLLSQNMEAKVVVSTESVKDEEEERKKNDKIVHSLLLSLFGNVKYGEDGRLVRSVDADVAYLNKQKGEVARF